MPAPAPRVRLGVWVSLVWTQWGLSTSYWTQWGSLTSNHWGGNGVCPQTSYWGDWSEVSEVLSTGSWSGTSGHTQPMCQVLADGGKCLYLPQSECAWGVLVYLLANFKLGQTVNRSPQVQAGLSGGQRIWGDLRVWAACGMSV